MFSGKWCGMSNLKESVKKRLSRPFMTDDIYTFIARNQRISLTIVLVFYIVSRIMSVLTVGLSYGAISDGEFFAKIVFHLSFLVLLFIGLRLVYHNKESISIGIIVISMVATFIFFLFNQPENNVIFIMSLFVRLLFIQMVMQFVFHNTKVNMIVFIISCVLVFYFAKDVLPFTIESDEGFDQFFITTVIYGMTLFILFILAINIQYQKIVRFIKQLTYVDYNLGLFNEKQLAFDFDEMIREKDSVVFIAVYITNLLSANRQIGHKEIQYEFLMRVKELKEILKGTSNLYKWEGPVLIFNLSDEAGRLDEFVEKIKLVFSRYKKFDQGKINFHTKILATVYPQDGQTVDLILKNLRVLKYSYHKIQDQRTDVIWFNEELYQKSQRILVLEKDIHDAVYEKLIQIKIQPKIDIKHDEKVFGGEVLARWKHETYGYISPLEFIPIIERENLMDRFTELIIDKTEPVIKNLKEKVNQEVNLAVNISATSLFSGFINDLLIYRLTDEQKGTYKGTELELTEHILFELTESSKRFIRELKQYGYLISIDDFGTGFSNFEYLQQMEIDFLKIDKRFIDEMIINEKSRHVVDAIIKMAHTLGVEVIAEGVETAEQKDILVEIDCDYVQGYYYSKPLEPTDFVDYVFKHGARE